MRCHSNSSAFAHFIIAIMIVFLFLTQEASPAQAVSEVQDSSDTVFKLVISEAEYEVCVGESVNLTITWGPNTSYDRAGGSVPLAPLTGPSRITLKASQGSFFPNAVPPIGSISGTSTVTYTADKVGTEKLFAVAWIGGSSDAIATDTFKVVACEYEYTLNAQFDMTVSDEDLTYTSRFTVKSRGTLTPTDPDEPRHLEARDKTVTMTATMISWSSSKCTLFTWEPATGMGWVDARADPGAMDIGMVLQLAPPRDLAWNMDYSFSCDGDGHTVAGVYPISSGDPWVSATFPLSTGRQNVVLDMFEVPFNKLNGAEGVTVSYTAALTLEKKESK